MGWTGHYVGSRFSSADKKAYLDKKFTWNDTKRNLTVLKSQMVGTTYYAAVNVKTEATSYVTAAVCLTRMDHGDFMYKDMDETTGPYIFNCPLSIMKLLTPTEHEYALEWRKKVYAYHQSQKKNTLREGDILRCKSPGPITWYSMKIEANEPFFVIYRKHRSKCYRFASKTKENLPYSLYTISKSIFDKCEFEFIDNIGGKNAR